MQSSHSNILLFLWTLLAIIASIVAIGLFPPLFGGLGILFGYMASRQHRGLGAALMIMAAIALIAGVIIGALWGMENIRF